MLEGLSSQAVIEFLRDYQPIIVAVLAGVAAIAAKTLPGINLTRGAKQADLFKRLTQRLLSGKRS